MHKYKRLFWIAAAVSVAALIVVPRIITGGQASGKKQKNAAVQGRQKVNVGVHIARFRPLNEMSTVPGTVLASEQVVLKAEASGRIIKLALREGAEVKKNDLLVKIYDTDLLAQLDKANAALKLSQDREKRQKTLLEKGMISQDDYDLMIKELSSSKADINLLEAQIAKTEIRAPFDGRVGLKMVSEGAYLSAGTPIADFVKTRPLKLEFSVPERYAARMAIGMTVNFTVRGSSVPHAAQVYALQPMIDEATRTLRARAVCGGRETGVTAGAFAEVTLRFGGNDSALVVPAPALVPDINGQNVYIVKDGKAVKSPVSIGVRDDHDVEIAGGVREGDTVVTTGVLMLRPGVSTVITTID
jgi:membrane fusion protein (multidrug efflux system)